MNDSVERVRRKGIIAHGHRSVRGSCDLDRARSDQTVDDGIRAIEIQRAGAFNSDIATVGTIRNRIDRANGQRTVADNQSVIPVSTDCLPALGGAVCLIERPCAGAVLDHQAEFAVLVDVPINGSIAGPR